MPYFSDKGKVCLRDIWKLLAAVKCNCPQPPLLQGSPHCVPYKVTSAPPAGLAGNNAVVKEVLDDRQAEKALCGGNIKNIGSPFLVWLFSIKIAV